MCEIKEHKKLGGRGSASRFINAENYSMSNVDKTILEKEYFGSLNFSKINTSLRNENLENVKDVIKVIDRNMKPLGKNITVERFVNDFFIEKVFGKKIDTIKKSDIVGKERIDKGYMSTSTEKSNIPYFATTKIKMIIDVPKGTKVLFSTKNKGTQEDEHEMLIHRGVKYKVLNFDKSFADSDYTMKVKVIK